MVVRLDKRSLDIGHAATVLQHVQGKLIFTTMSRFVRGTLQMLYPLPSAALGALRLLHHLDFPAETPGFSIVLDAEAMIWHGTTWHQIQTSLKDTDLLGAPMWHSGQPVLFATLRQIVDVHAQECADGDKWSVPVPSSMREGNRPSIADIFCAPRGLIIHSSVAGELLHPRHDAASHHVADGAGGAACLGYATLWRRGR